MNQEVETIINLAVDLRDTVPWWKELGNIRAQVIDNYMILNYTQAALYEDTWNPFEIVCRGLIINLDNGEVVARPFDKFFNWGQGGRTTSAPVRHVYEKMDGSLGIMYRRNGEYYIATRGSMDSPQALWATEFWNRNYEGLSVPDSWTMLFEIVYPDNRIVVDYGDTQALVLIAVRNRFTGEYIPFDVVSKFANNMGFTVPKVYDFDEAGQILANTVTLDANHEGYVVEFADGQRFKFKGAEYMKLARLISGLSFKNALAVFQSNQVDDVRSSLPDEFLGEFDGWIREIEDVVATTKNQVDTAFAAAPDVSDRKSFALWATTNHKSIRHYLFAKADGKEIEPLIFKTAFNDRGD